MLLVRDAFAGSAGDVYGPVIMLALLLFSVVAGLAINAAIGFALGRSKNRGDTGFLLGGMLGPIGWIIVLLLPHRTTRTELRARIEREERIRADVRKKLAAEDQRMPTNANKGQ